jgi:hypothetical protein
MHIQFWLEKRKEIDHLKDPHMDNIKVYLREMACDYVVLIQDRDQWQGMSWLASQDELWFIY